MSVVIVGQTYRQLIIPPEVLKSPNYPLGKNSLFAFSPIHVLQLTNVMVIGLFAIQKLHKRQAQKNIFNLETILYCLLFLSVGYSTVHSIFFTPLSMLLFLDAFGFFAFIITISLCFRAHPTQKTTILNQLLIQLLLVTLFHTTLAGVQFLKQSPIGLAIESTQQAVVFGNGSGESSQTFRPISVYAHANILALYLLQYCISICSLFAYLNQKKRSRVKSIAIGLTLFALLLVAILTQSRAFFVSLAIGVSGYALSNFYQAKTLVGNMWKMSKPYALLFLLFSMLLLPIVVTRISDSFDYFTTYGGYETRKSLETEALAIFQRNWLFGIGYSLFVPANYYYHPQGVSRYFPESVHNGYILHMVESGFVGIFLYALLQYLLVRKTLFLSVSKSVKTVILWGLAAQAMFAFFHPVVIVFSLYNYVVFTLIYAET